MMKTIREVMTTDVTSVSPQDSIRRAAEIMDDINVGALPVVDGQRLAGMVTDRDITVRATAAGLQPEDTLVEQVMSADALFCFDDQTVEEVMEDMRDIQIRRIPVLSRDSRALIGIVSLGDLATEESESGAVTATLRDISTPSEPDRPQA